MSSIAHFLASFLHAFSHFAPWAFALAVAGDLAQQLVRSRAWHNVLAAAFPAAKPRFRDTFGVYLVKNTVGELLPMHGDDAIRVELMRPRIEGASSAAVAATVGVELVSDLVFTLLLVAATAALGVSAVDWHGIAAHPAGPAVVAGVIVMGVVAAWIAMRRRARNLGDEIKQGLLVFRDRRAYARGVLGWQLLDVALQLATLYFFLRAFGFPAVPFASVLAIRTAQRVTVSLPGFVEAGSQQAMIMAVLGHGGHLGQAAGFALALKVTQAGLDWIPGLIASRWIVRPAELKAWLAARRKRRPADVESLPSTS
jgi:uncharacterized membrane protein YbhN (UPF0104 family)